jgi:hypothetical protein
LSDTFSVVVPLVNDSFFVSDFLPAGDTVTLPSGVLGLRVHQGDMTFGFTDFLQSTQVSTSQVIAATAGGSGQQDTVRFSTPDGSDVTGAVIDWGFVVRTLTNNSNCTATISLSVLDALDSMVVVFPAAVVPANGSVTDSVNTAGASLSGFAKVTTGATFGCGTPVGDVATGITFRPMTLASVTLANLNESFDVMVAGELVDPPTNFAAWQAAIAQSTINEATIDFTVSNTADLPVQAVDFTFGAVRLDSTGGLTKDAAGDLVYETDANGNPIKIPVASIGQNTLAIPRQGTASVSVQSVALVDRILHMLFANERVAFVVEGTAAASDGSAGTLAFADAIEVSYTVTIGLDFTAPAAGIELELNLVSDGMHLTSKQADDFALRVINADVSFLVTNPTAFGVEVVVAIAAGALADSVDVFAQPGAIFLDTMALDAPSVDAAGAPQGSTTDSVVVSLTGDEARPLFGELFTAGIRVRLLPGSTGRGAIHADDKFVVSARAVVQVRRGGSGG